ncbi:uncharacterized protein LOC102782806 [Neolamprologus brichardi]|uniref:uncharacterized protein LOC102782806 n=1 Tax=Neolamprologus brichardi TaxID=32507 RepID=UPI0016437F24|nr:uncharacterized protein LOC102782806 [Neolamprologus brichardi]
MKLFPHHPVIWSSLLVLWFTQCESEGHTLNACQEKMDDQYELGMVLIRTSAQQDSYEDLTDIKEKFICLLYPTNELNCSWSFNTLEKDTKLSVFISVCNEETAIKSLSRTFAERVGSMSLTVSEEISGVVLHFNMSLHNWISYTYVYDMDTLEHLPPPANISASFNNDNLPTVTPSMERSDSVLKPVVIVFICLGVPMGLLALLLFVRYQRVTKVLFPPIPHPPAKYKYFLEKSDAFNFFYSTPSAKPEEVITEVEDTGKNPGK